MNIIRDSLDTSQNAKIHSSSRRTVAETKQYLFAVVATLAWTPWRHGDRFDVAARWRDLTVSVCYFQGGSRGCLAAGLLSQRQRQESTCWIAEGGECRPHRCRRQIYAKLPVLISASFAMKPSLGVISFDFLGVTVS